MLKDVWTLICEFLARFWPFYWLGIKPPTYTNFDDSYYPKFPKGVEAWRADVEFVYRYFDHERRNLAVSTIAALCLIRDQVRTRSGIRVNVYIAGVGSVPWTAPVCLEYALQNYWIGYGIVPASYKRHDD